MLALHGRELFAYGKMTHFARWRLRVLYTIDINPRYEDCLAYYAAYMAYSDDCTDPVSKALADDFLAKFKTFAQM